MKAFVVDRYGKKRALRLADVPAPELRDDEVWVEVHAAGVNLLDSKIRDGEFKLILPYRLPLISGPPDPEFAKEINAPWFVKQVMRVLSSGIRRKASGRGVDFSFLFMKANGSQFARDHPTHRCWIHPSRRGSGLPLRIDQGGHGLCRSTTRKRQGRRITQVKRDGRAT